MMLILGIGKEAAFTHLGRAARDIRFFRAPDVRLVQFLPFVAGDIYLWTGAKDIGEQVRAHMQHRGAALSNCYRVLVVERFAVHFLVRDGAQKREFENNRRVGSETPQNVGNCAIQAGDDRAHTNDCSGPNDHAQHCKERAHLVFAHGVQC